MPCISIYINGKGLQENDCFTGYNDCIYIPGLFSNPETSQHSDASPCAEQYASEIYRTAGALLAVELKARHLHQWGIAQTVLASQGAFCTSVL